MQDLKHLSQKKSSSLFKLFGSRNKNRRLKSSGDTMRYSLSLPTGKRLQKLKMLLLFIAVILAITPLCVLTLRHAESAGAHVSTWIASFIGAISKPAKVARVPVKASSFETASGLLVTAETDGPNVTARTPEGMQLTYTIHGELQQRVYGYLAKYQVPYGVFVAIEPASGRILGMTAYSSVDTEWAKRSAYELYPMASLFKIITAAAALENDKITPESVIEFRGKAYSENPRYWDVSPYGRNNQMNASKKGVSDVLFSKNKRSIS